MARLRAGAANREGLRRRRYGSDIKKLIIHQHFELSRSTAHIAISLSMPQRAIHRIVKMWREIGDVIREPQRVGRAKILSDVHVRVSSNTCRSDLLLILVNSTSSLPWREPPTCI